MKVYNILPVSFLFLVFFSCSNDEMPEVKYEDRHPSCEELELIEMEHPESSFSVGDSLKAVVRNTCKSCELQAVYTGLIAYSGQDTLAIDVKLSTQLTPENGQNREYQLRVLKEFSLNEVTRIEMYGICESIVLEF